MIRTTSFCVALSVAACFLSCAGANAEPLTSCNIELTVKEASSLARLVVEHQIRDIKPKGKFSLDKTLREPDSRFYTFEALGVWTAKPGSAVLGNYAVNRRNGTVWDMTSCKRIMFRDLVKMQRHFCSHSIYKAELYESALLDNPPSLC